MHSTQTVLSETTNESMDIEESIINTCDGMNSTTHIHTQQAQLDTATFQQVLDIFPDIENNFVRTEYENCANAFELVNRISEMGDYPKTSQIPIQNPYYSEQLQCLINVFPDADETFLEEKSMLKKIEFEQFVHDTLQNKMYPRKQAKKIETKSSDDDFNLYTTSFSVQNFLRVIPDPFEHYMDEKRPCTYSIHGWQFLKRRYRYKNSYYSKELNQVYSNYGYNLSLTCNYLDNNNPKLRKKAATNSHELWMPEALNVPFLKEACFIEHKAEIKAYLDEQAEAEDKEFQEAKAKGDLIECGCCYDQVTFYNCVSCTNGDLFCVKCVKKSSEIRISQGLTDFPCLQDCGGVFSLQLLGHLLDPRLFSKAVNEIQISEVKAANIEGLEECPFCQYATIPPPDTRVFDCLNPDCLKESCRQCRKPSHIPLRCEEVETDKQTEARKFIEDEMTKALVRECYSCKKPFIKTDGCNKMTCSCGALMCYVCRQPVTGYMHFNGQGGSEFHKCPLYTTDKLMHVDAVKARAEQALKELDVKLVFDPTKILPDASKVNTALPYGIFQDELLVLQRAVGIQMQQVQNNAGGVQIQHQLVQHNGGGVQVQPQPIQHNGGGVQAQPQPIQNQRQPVQHNGGGVQPVQHNGGGVQPVQHNGGGVQVQPLPIQNQRQPVQHNGGGVQPVQHNGGGVQPVQHNGGGVQVQPQPIQNQHQPVQHNGGGVQPVQHNGGGVQAVQNNGGGVQVQPQPIQNQCQPVQHNGGGVQVQPQPIQNQVDGVEIQGR